MALVYTLVKRPDMSKGAVEGAMLYHAQTSVTNKLDLNNICGRIEEICTASRGEILLVLDGLMKVMNRALAGGESIHLGEFGSFRMVAGSKGVKAAADFSTSLFNRAHIVFYPGTMLIQTARTASFERYVQKKDITSDGAPTDPNPDENPDIL